MFVFRNQLKLCAYEYLRLKLIEKVEALKRGEFVVEFDYGLDLTIPIPDFGEDLCVRARD